LITLTATRKRNRQKVWWRYLIAAVCLVFALMPAIWVMGAAFGPSGLTTQSVIPRQFSLDNFRALFSDGNVPFARWYRNSLVICISAALMQVGIATFAAYAFSRFRFKGRRLSLVGLLILQMFPQLLSLVAIYLLMYNVSLVFPAIGVGSSIGLILVYLGGAMGYNTYLLKGFFDSIPKEIDEAAKVDGATAGQTFRQIILPLAVPMLAVVMLLSFIGLLNDFLLASVFLQTKEEYTLAVGLQAFVSGQYEQQWGPFAAGALLTAIPIIVMFQFLQRYIVEGLSAGSVKG
jgi:arabinogalactan oligomer/maltooligosaccharide transport system permease protein